MRIARLRSRARSVRSASSRSTACRRHATSALEILQTERFADGDYDTKFLEELYAEAAR